MSSSEKLLTGEKVMDAEQSEEARRILAILEHPFVKNMLDWAPLILFYILRSYVKFEFACLWSTLAGCGTILCTQVRSMLNPRVMSPKVLDVGFVVLFGLLALFSFTSVYLGFFLMVWCNPLVNLGLTLIVAGGNVIGRPFVLAYAKEEVPVAIWENPNIQANIIKGCTIASQQWVYLFLAMTIVSAIPPIIQVARHNKVSPFLDLWVGQIAQYVILGLGFFKFMVWDKWQREKMQARLRETAETLQGEYGPPLSPTPVPAAANCPRGTTISTLSSKDLPEAAVLLCKAFWEDPLFTAWPGIGDLSNVEREAAMEKALVCHLRQMERWGHIFGVFETDWIGKRTLRAVIGCVPAWRGDETELAWSGPSFAMAGWDGPPPAEETTLLAKDRIKYLNGKPHLYIWLYGGDPDGQGKGFGRAALQHALSIADERGVPAVLETCTLSNRKHYQHKGFEQISECAVPGCKEPWTLMVREPQKKAAGYGSIV